MSLLLEKVGIAGKFEDVKQKISTWDFTQEKLR